MMLNQDKPVSSNMAIVVTVLAVIGILTYASLIIIGAVVLKLATVVFLIILGMALLMVGVALGIAMSFLVGILQNINPIKKVIKRGKSDVANR